MSSTPGAATEMVTVKVQSASSEHKYATTDAAAPDTRPAPQQQQQKNPPAAATAVAVGDQTTAGATASSEQTSVPAPADRSTVVNVILLVVLAGAGIFMGVAYHRVGILDAKAVFGQMTWKVYVVLKMFVSGLGCSLLAAAGFSFFAPALFERTRVRTRVGWLRSIFGGLLVGIGMSMTGTGTTIVHAAVGASSELAFVTLLCHVGGAFAYCLLERLIRGGDALEHEACQLALPPQPKTAAAAAAADGGSEGPSFLESTTFDEWLGIKRFWAVAGPAGAAMVIFIWCFEYFVMTAEHDQNYLTLGKILWPTSSIGFVIGATQAALRIVAFGGVGVAAKNRGGVAGTQTIVSFLTWGWLAPAAFPNAVHKVFDLVYYWLGCALGGYISLVTAADQGVVPSKGFALWRYIVGGFVGVIGASLTASGCTCGSSLSAVSELSIEGMVVTACIFAGAIPTAFILDAAGATSL